MTANPCIESYSYKSRFPSRYEFALLFEDRAFVDYLNVFMCLPVFGQHVLYKFDEGQFVYEPLIPRRKFLIHRTQVIEWCRAHRYAMFQRSELYLEYLLCAKLREASISPVVLRKRCMNLDPENNDVAREFAMNVIGSVAGMQLFRESLRGTSGEHVFRCWLDLERYSNLGETESERLDMFNYIKTTYLMCGAPAELSEQNKKLACRGILNFDVVPESATVKEMLSEIRNLFLPYTDDTFSINDPEAFRGLQRALLVALRSYWVPRHLIHITNTASTTTIEELCKRSQYQKRDTEVIRKEIICYTMFPEIYAVKADLKSSTDVFISTDRGDIPASDSCVPEIGSSSDEDLDINPTNIDPRELLNLWGGGTFKKEESPDKSRPSSSMSWSGESPRNMTNLSWDSSPRRSRCGSTRCSRYGSGRASLSDTSLSTLTTSISISPERQQVYIPNGRRRSCRSGLPLPRCLRTYLGRQNNNLVCRSRWLLGALASDNSAGQPFRKYLADQNMNKELQCLGFWNDVRGYLASRDSSNDPRLGETRRLMARDIAERYLSSSKDRCSIFSERLKMSLFRCLVNQADDTLIFASQDIISETLRLPWKRFLHADRNAFIDSACGKRQISPIKRPKSWKRVSDEISAGSRSNYYFNQTGRPKKSSIMSSLNVEVCTESRPQSHIAGMSIGITQDQLWLAFELVVACNGTGHPSHRKVSVEDLPKYAQDSVGSLYVPEEQVFEMESFRHLVTKPEIKVADMKISRKVIIKEPPKGLKRVEGSERFMIRRNGVIIHRPSKPRNFIECITVPTQFDFFKRFMVVNKALQPLVFWKTVEEMKAIKNPKMRHSKVLHIARKFFNKAAKYGAGLDCNDEIIRQIPQMDKVTASILVCAQASIFRSMERKWYTMYMDTYPPDAEARDTPSLQNINLVELNTMKLDWAPKRRIAKARTYNLWHGFTHSIGLFLKAFANPIELKLLHIFLTKEMENDSRRSPTKQDKMFAGSSTNVAQLTRVVLRNKLIIVNKLPSDLLFWVEVAKYRQLVSNTTKNAAKHTISARDADIIINKARAIIDCFLASEVPPKCQINIPGDLSHSIISSFSILGPQIGLFHEAAMIIFPLLYHYWRQMRVTWLHTDSPESYMKQMEAHNEKHSKPRPRTPHKMTVLPDYLHANVNDYHTLHVHSIDDEIKINFTLSHGIRVLIPRPREKGDTYIRTDSGRLTKHGIRTSTSKMTSFHTMGRHTSTAAGGERTRFGTRNAQHDDLGKFGGVRRLSAKPGDLPPLSGDPRNRRRSSNVQKNVGQFRRGSIFQQLPPPPESSARTETQASYNFNEIVAMAVHNSSHNSVRSKS